MLLFLDSNIICSNYYMAGPSFEVAKRVGTIVLGQIVVDEVCNKYKENLEDQVTKVKNVIQDLNKLLPESQVIWTEIDVVENAPSIKTFWKCSLLKAG